MGTYPKSALLSLCLLVLSVDALRLYGQPDAPQAVPRLRTSFRSGSGIQGRIVGGNEANWGEWPGIVSVQNQYALEICGGSIINERYVLTAASCLAGMRAANLIVVTSTLDTWNLTAPYYFIDQIHMHCNFDKPLYHNDIALLHLTEPIVFDSVTAPIPLAEVDELEEGEKLYFAGWGTSEPSGDRSRLLLKSEGTYISVDNCRNALKTSEDVDCGHACVQMEKGKGMCHHDTGGPLVNAKGQLVGIANFGVPCGQGFPDVYARAAFYNDWIRTVINGCNIV